MAHNAARANGPADNDSPFNNPDAGKATAVRATSPPAEVVGGTYAANLCDQRLSDKGRKAMSKLNAVRVSDLAALGLLIGSKRPTEGDVAGWYSTRHSIWNPPTRNIASRSDVRITTEGIDATIARALSDIVRADGDGQPWAAAIIDQARDDNAYASMPGLRNSPRPLAFTPAQLLDAGVPLDAIAALPALTNRSRGESARLIRQWDAEDRTEATARAAAEAAARAAAALDIPDRLDLATFVPPEVLWVVDDLIPAGASLGLFAERKAGKTTTVVELARALLGGDPFLGRFATRLPVDSRVAVIDTEMTATMLHDEYTRAGVPLDRLDVWALRGHSRLLDMRDGTNRDRWRDRIAPGSFIVVDCLYTILAALTIDENAAQVADVIEGIKTLAVECNAAGWCIVHHLGKDSTKGARGHSSIEGGVDTVAWIMLDGQLSTDTPRTFEAIGRHDVAVPRALLVRDGNRRLTISDTTPQGDRRRARDHGDDDRAYALIAANPGKSVNALSQLPDEARRGLSRDRLRNAVERLALIGGIANKGTDNAPAWHAVTGGDPMTPTAPDDPADTAPTTP